MEKKKINNAVKVTGWLDHDNKLFDRTCTQCNGMYSSLEVATCPKCNAALTYITTVKGTPMAVSEGTIRLMLGQAARDGYEKNLTNIKYSMPAKHRFKVFSFADERNVLPLPALHGALRKGALVEIMIFDHPVEHKHFVDGNEVLNVECMYRIYPTYNDTVKVLKAPEAVNARVSHEINPDGSPALMSDPYPGAPDAQAQTAVTPEALEALMKRLLVLEQAEAQKNADPQAETAAQGGVDPFEGV